jgi:acyl-CoA thioester hydrolase
MSDSVSEHVFPVRVYYEDTDAGGVVYHSNYLCFAERARTELLRDFGIDHTSLMADDGLMFAVRRCEAEYVKPARLDDALEIRTRCIEASGASFWLEQLVQRAGETLVEMKLRLVCLKSDGRPARLPEKLRSLLMGAAVPMTQH